MSYFVVCPLSQLSITAHQHQPRELISLMHRDAILERPSMIAQSNHHVLAFNDITEPRDKLIPPSHNDITALLEIAYNWNRNHPLLIHCYMGISRSTAAAYLMACALLPEMDEFELAYLLRKNSPTATPNKLMIALADDILNRSGRMQNAIEQIGRGAEAFEGTPFILPIAS